MPVVIKFTDKVSENRLLFTHLERLDYSMKQLIEFIPIILFVLVYFYSGDIYLATMLLMGGIGVQVVFEYIQDGAISRRTRIIFWVVLLAGGATLVFRDELFIKWKPSIVNWLFCATLLTNQVLGKENLLKRLLGGQLKLPDKVWKNLALGWAFGFFLAGALNLVVAYRFSTDFWVAYKLVGGLGITLCYLVITLIYLVKGGYIQEQKTKPFDPAE